MYKIIPSAYLRNKYSQIAGFAKQNHEPVVLTKNGEGDLIIMSLELFQEKEIELEIYKRLAENKMDLSKGHFQTGEEISNTLSKYIKNDNTELIADLKKSYLINEETQHV
ncbi:MAG: type II toxin-antitoxin system Phd/YefM family antitoxin [Clostridia bacterium]|nr:type II toxin-antitoxin system Phd/YefM family antitoxin [Clostridia bacterium]